MSDFVSASTRVYEEINIQDTGGTDYAEQLFLKAADICELLEIKQTSAYENTGNLNREQEEQGYLTLRGKVPTKYFVKRFYGVEGVNRIWTDAGLKGTGINRAPKIHYFRTRYREMSIPIIPYYSVDCSRKSVVRQISILFIWNLTVVLQNHGCVFYLLSLF